MEDTPWSPIGLTPGEVLARAINAEAWEPMPGHIRTTCVDCRYVFATLQRKPRSICPDCVALRRRGARFGKVR